VRRPQSIITEPFSSPPASWYNEASLARAEPAPRVHGSDHRCETCAQDNSLELNVNNFDAEVKKYHAVLVNFYAPWCPFCRMLHPGTEPALHRVVRVCVHEACT
jgi:thiol-disulfide isomerase/thioredoxin